MTPTTKGVIMAKPKIKLEKKVPLRDLQPGTLVVIGGKVYRFHTRSVGYGSGRESYDFYPQNVQEPCWRDNDVRLTLFANPLTKVRPFTSK
jgi:hypothetical protein